MTSDDAPSGRRRYRLRFFPAAWDEWLALDGSVRKTLKQHLEKRLINPHRPGSVLNAELVGLYKIKLLRQGIRLIYSVNDGLLLLIVFSIGKREDAAAYRSALVRLKQAKDEGQGLAVEASPA
ncbi:type II toxin-antitoxin system RelE/ParE family toxin [Roseateles sp.]|uniref:type II toxin-antitoxin system RelE family toxin n=1 Tax=Roseateles sp. TaxID=1971397 RepID=UPI0031E18F4E